ncbi:MAG TPA: ABC transporter substrate-binding protein, partial [Candidatus Limnocylindria bacterium]|nr:ABC transporter substrate-binding protein [Candidatus Limnocylindria bacterium]
ISSLIFLKQHTPPTDNHVLTIGILQTASHPALDAAREGFEDTVRTALDGKVEFVVRNAQGSITSAHTIAQSFHANPTIAGIYAIATPAAQAIASVEKEKPIFLAAVTDPHAAGVLQPNGNVCGSTDMVTPDTIVNLVKTLVPQAKTVGLLYNSGEINSKIQVERLTAALRAQGLQPLEVGVTSEADVPAATTSVCQKADVIVLPNDNVMSSSIQLIASLALKYKKPLIASDNLLVKHGALAARGVDYKASGAQAGTYAVDVLQHGKKPSELPLAQPVMGPIMINKKVASELGIVIPTNTQSFTFFFTDSPGESMTT